MYPTCAYGLSFCGMERENLGEFMVIDTHTHTSSRTCLREADKRH